MRNASAKLAFAILLLLLVPMLISSSGVNPTGSQSSRVLSSTHLNPTTYSENLAMYVTSTQSLWKANLSGGNISLGVAVPSSVSSFLFSLSHYSSWSSQYEVFTKYGFGYLGPNEPMPNETVLAVDTTSQSDADSLASALGQKLALSYMPYSSNSSSYSFIAPVDYATVLHIYLWNILPHSMGGFANYTTEQAFESQKLSFFDVAYSSGAYSISYGAIAPLASSQPFSLYTQLGLSGPINYSSSGSTVSLHVLGGLVTSSNYTFTNHYQNFSSFVTTSAAPSSNLTVPNLGASLDFSFPTIVAYRQISPLDPTPGSTVSVSVTVKDVSPSGTVPVNVSVADNWYSMPGFNKTGGSSSANYNLTSGNSQTTIYFVKVPSTAGTFTIPSTPVTYTFKAANNTLTATSYLNEEIMLVGATSAAALESIQNLNTTSISAGQPFSLLVYVKNWGPGPAVNVTIPGHTPFNLGPGSTQNYSVSAAPTSLTQTNATAKTTVVWSDSSGSHNETTNGVNAVYSFGNPGSPGTSLSKFISVSKTKTYANVTLSLTNSGTSSLTNLTVIDPIASGMGFGHSIGNASSSISASTSANDVTLKVRNMTAGKTISYQYNVTISNPNDNYVVLPANVSTAWNGITIVHYSQGAGVALGVIATKQLSPNTGFEGTNSSELFDITNRGSLPVYYVSFANSTDSFLSYSSSQVESTPVLGPGNSFNSTLGVNMTGTPGSYNSSASAAAFIFSGTNQTAQSNVFSVTIYQVLSSKMSTASPKIEENHNININLTVSNPSNVTVSNVIYSVSLPPNLKLVSSGSLQFSIGTMGPGQSASRVFTVSTSIPFQYTIAGGNLTFQYQNRNLKGTTTPLVLNIADDLLTRYAIPVVIGIVIVIGTLFYVRRLARKPSV